MKKILAILLICFIFYPLLLSVKAQEDDTWKEKYDMFYKTPETDKLASELMNEQEKESIINWTKSWLEIEEGEINIDEEYYYISKDLPDGRKDVELVDYVFDFPITLTDKDNISTVIAV